MNILGKNKKQKVLCTFVWTKVPKTIKGEVSPLTTPLCSRRFFTKSFGAAYKIKDFEHHTKSGLPFAILKTIQGDTPKNPKISFI